MRVIGYGASVSLTYDRNVEANAWGGFFDAELMNGATVYLDEQQQAIKGDVIGAVEILKDRRVVK